MIELTPENARRAQLVLAKRAQLRLYQQHPEQWYVERFGGKVTDLKWSDWPGYENHEWDGTPDPFYTTFKSLANWTNVGIESATSTGKTFMAARVAYWFLDTFPDSLVVTTAPKEMQLRAILWAEMSACFARFRKLRPRAEMFDLRVLPDGTKVKYGKNLGNDDDEFKDMHQALGVVAGVRAGEESATKMQGFHRKYMLFIIEEAAGVPLPVLTAIKNTCTGDYNVIMAIGNPDSVTDSLHQFCEGGNVQHVRISAYDHPNIVLGRTVVDGAVSNKSIEIRRVEYGEESNFFRSRVRGIAPEQSTDSLIMMKWIMQCCRFHPSFDRSRFKEDTFSRPAVGVDVANSLSGDAACLAWGVDNQLKELHEFQCPNATHLADNLVKDDNQLIAEGKQNYATKKLTDFGVTADHVGVDGVGVGVATVNQFSELGYTVVSLMGGQDETAIPKDKEGKPLYKFANMRAQMWFQARIDLQNCDLSIDIVARPILMQLAKELTMVRYKVNDGHIIIEKKEDIKERLGGKSPNMGDAFVYWNWVRKKRSGMFDEMPVGYAYTESEDVYDEHFSNEPDKADELNIWRPDPGQLL